MATYIGSVTPHLQTVNVRGCRRVDDKRCPPVLRLKVGEWMPVLEVDHELGWYKVEIVGIGQAWVAKHVVTFTKSR